MKILMASGEMTPFIRIGELAGAIEELSGDLLRLGHEVAVVLPLYRAIRENKTLKLKKSKLRFNVAIGTDSPACEILETTAPNGVQVFFVVRDEYFDRSGIYGSEGRDYQDNAARFIFLTKCVVELARRMEAPPDILHVHSWETALAPVFVRDQRLRCRTVLTPHALDFQGNFWSYDFALTNLPGEYFSARGVEYFGSMNCLKGGILFADAVVLSSERMVCAAQTPEHGCGLDVVLREHQQKLRGIPSGTCLEHWKPDSDDALTAKFSADRPGPRSKNRPALMETLGFADDASGPVRTVLVAMTDAWEGGGLDLLLASLDRLLTDDVRLILLGPVANEDTFALEIARRKHSGRFVHCEKFDEKLARLALAGSDIFLLPGGVEPQAVWLRRAMRYGAIPLALQCGGLFQFVRDWEPAQNAGNGFVFFAPSVNGLVDACRRAMKVLNNAPERATLQERCLRTDFSREASARGHETLYERLLGIELKSGS